MYKEVLVKHENGRSDGGCSRPRLSVARLGAAIVIRFLGQLSILVQFFLGIVNTCHGLLDTVSL